MLKKYVAYGPGFSGDYDTSEEAWAVCANHPEGHVYIAVDMDIAAKNILAGMVRDRDAENRCLKDQYEELLEAVQPLAQTAKFFAREMDDDEVICGHYKGTSLSPVSQPTIRAGWIRRLGRWYKKQ